MHYPRPLLNNSLDPVAVDFRAFYPYTPNEVKHRKRTTTHQLNVLESVFKSDTKPNAQLRQDLALELSMSARGVQVWFQNRRAKEKARLGRVSSFVNDPDDDGGGGGGSGGDSTLVVVVKSELVPNETALADPACEHSKHASLTPASQPQLPSPPQLRVVTDTSACDWEALGSPLENPPPDSAASAETTAVPSDAFYSLRRGSLPITTAFAHQHLSPDSDPLVRRCSVDASLQRLASHPYASLARAKNSALYGPGVGVLNNDINNTAFTNYRSNRAQCLPNRLQQRRFVSSSALSSTAAAHYAAAMPPHAAYVRRLSMDSRASSRLSQMQRTYYSPSPSPLSSYGATVRASLPADPHFYSLANRSIASPLPGPLPQPGFQFGAASSSTPSVASPSSAGSERNSPDSLKSFAFGGEEEPSSRYEAYSSRFGSVASIATSESSVHSIYYGSTVERRDSSSCTTPYMGLSHEMDVMNHHHPVEYVRNGPSVAEIDPSMGMGMGMAAGVVAVGYSSPSEEYASYQGTEADPAPVYSVAYQKQQQDHKPKRSTVADGDLPISHPQDPPPPPALLVSSSSSELAFALKSENSDITISTGTSTGHSLSQEAYATSYDHSVGQMPVEQQCHQQFEPATTTAATYYGTDDVQQQMYQQERPSVYASSSSSAYPFASDASPPPPPPSEYGMFSSTGDYSDSSSSHMLMNQAFVGAYS